MLRVANIEQPPQMIGDGPITRVEIEWAMRYIRALRADTSVYPSSYGSRIGRVISALTNDDLIDDWGVRHAWDGEWETGIELLIKSGLDLIY